jgi:hypothetical protein
LVEAITIFLGRDPVSNLGRIRECLERAIDEAGPDALTALSARLGGRADACEAKHGLEFV